LVLYYKGGIYIDRNYHTVVLTVKSFFTLELSFHAAFSMLRTHHRSLFVQGRFDLAKKFTAHAYEEKTDKSVTL
jgi:hypothetical protein